MKLLYLILLSTFFMPFSFSMAMESAGNKDYLREEYRNLRIIITPDMRLGNLPFENQRVSLQKEAEELGIKGWDEMNFNDLSMVVYKAKLQKKVKS